MIAPATIRPPPSAFVQVSGSPRNSAAKTITRATLSLSIGATREAAPNLKRVKVADPGESGGQAGERQEEPRLRAEGVGAAGRRATRAIIQVNTTTTEVRTAVARFASTPETPILARMAVTAAKRAESRDQTSQAMGLR